MDDKKNIIHMWTGVEVYSGNLFYIISDMLRLRAMLLPGEHCIKLRGQQFSTNPKIIYSMYVLLNHERKLHLYSISRWQCRSWGFHAHISLRLLSLLDAADWQQLMFCVFSCFIFLFGICRIYRTKTENQAIYSIWIINMANILSKKKLETLCL